MCQITIKYLLVSFKCICYKWKSVLIQKLQNILPEQYYKIKEWIDRWFNINTTVKWFWRYKNTVKRKRGCCSTPFNIFISRYIFLGIENSRKHNALFGSNITILLDNKDEYITQFYCLILVWNWLLAMKLSLLYEKNCATHVHTDT